MFCLRLIFLLILLYSLNTGAQAKFHFANSPINTQNDLQLIKYLTKNPQLLDTNYLSCYLGKKFSSMKAPASISLRTQSPIIRTYWFDTNNQYVRYVLEQGRPNPNKSLADFSIILTRPENVLSKELDKIFDRLPHKAIDEHGKSVLAYFVSRNIKVFAHQHSHLVNLTKISLQYSGPSLPPPTTSEMEEAFQHRYKTALENAQVGQYNQAIPLLQTHLKSYPNDAQAHLELANTYKASSCLNKAISEYKLGLLTSGDNKEISDKCIKGLQTLKINLPRTALSNPSNFSNTSMERININNSSSNNSSSPVELNLPAKVKSIDVEF